MINNHLPYEQQKALEAICRSHGVQDKDLIADLATFGNWIRTDEQDKARLNRVPQAPYLIVLLSTMGIYGKKVLDKSPEKTS